MWVPLGYIVKMALFLGWSGSNQRRKTIRPLVEAVPPLVLFWPPQAANNSRQSPMRRPITSTTRRDDFPISEWYMPLLLSSLISVADMLTVVAPLSWEVGDGFLTC